MIQGGEAPDFGVDTSTCIGIMCNEASVSNDTSMEASLTANGLGAAISNTSQASNSTGFTFACGAVDCSLTNTIGAWVTAGASISLSPTQIAALAQIQAGVGNDLGITAGCGEATCAGTISVKAGAYAYASGKVSATEVTGASKVGAGASVTGEFEASGSVGSAGVGAGVEVGSLGAGGSGGVKLEDGQVKVTIGAELKIGVGLQLEFTAGLNVQPISDFAHGAAEFASQARTRYEQIVVYVDPEHARRREELGRSYATQIEDLRERQLRLMQRLVEGTYYYGGDPVSLSMMIEYDLRVLQDLQASIEADMQRRGFWFSGWSTGGDVVITDRQPSPTMIREIVKPGWADQIGDFIRDDIGGRLNPANWFF